MTGCVCTALYAVAIAELARSVTDLKKVEDSVCKAGGCLVLFGLLTKKGRDHEQTSQGKKAPSRPIAVAVFAREYVKTDTDTLLVYSVVNYKGRRLYFLKVNILL